MKKFRIFLLAHVSLFFLAFGICNATTISYTATYLTDGITGDLWEYSYTVSDNTFAADTGFTIFFELGLYDLIDPAPVAPNADWDVLTWDPDSSLPDDGAYDALALVDSASLADAFTVSFVWLGSGNPGSQAFEVYRLRFVPIYDGNTSPVPEPATMVLFGIGIACLAGLRKRFQQE